MRFARYQYGSAPIRSGWVLGDQIGPLEGSPLGEYRRLEVEHPVENVRLLAPVEPGKIICVARNYISHAQEMNQQVSEIPVIFFKPPSSVIGPGEPIILPPQSTQVDHEAELAVIIGRKGRWIPVEDVDEFILGYTIANDITARDLQLRDGQYARSKGFDTFCPTGPWVETDLDTSDLIITCHVNDEMRQMVSTREMVFTVPQLIVFISSVMTLLPGDMILTGTPAGIGPISPGDEVIVSIEGIGKLRNPVQRHH